MFLDVATFQTVIASTPLVSIDLIVESQNNEFLVGRRNNAPAKGYWFVPGGRIVKDESMSNAFKRLTKEELGQEYCIQEAKLLGPFDHFYSDNVFNDQFTTHYVAIAYKLILSQALTSLPIGQQHNQYRWLTKTQLIADPSVHTHTKWYFETR